MYRRGSHTRHEDDDEVASVGGISSITQSANVSADGGSHDGDRASRGYTSMRGKAIAAASTAKATSTAGGAPTRRDNIMAMLARYDRISFTDFGEVLRVCDVRCDQTAKDDLWLTAIGDNPGRIYAPPEVVCDLVLANGGRYVGNAQPYSGIGVGVALRPFIDDNSTILAPTTSSKERAAAAATIRARSPALRNRSPRPMYIGVAQHPPIVQAYNPKLAFEHRAELQRRERSSTPKRSEAELRAIAAKLHHEADRRRRKFEEKFSESMQEKKQSELAECTGKPHISASSLRKLELTARAKNAFDKPTESSGWKIKGAEAPSLAREETPPPPAARGRPATRVRTPSPLRVAPVRGFYESVTRMRQASPQRSTSPLRIFEESLRSNGNNSSVTLSPRPASTFGHDRSSSSFRKIMIPGLGLQSELDRHASIVETTLGPHLVSRYDINVKQSTSDPSLLRQPTCSSRRLLDDKVRSGEISEKMVPVLRESLSAIETASLIANFSCDRTSLSGRTRYEDLFRARLQATTSPTRRVHVAMENHSFASPTKSANARTRLRS